MFYAPRSVVLDTDKINVCAAMQWCLNYFSKIRQFFSLYTDIEGTTWHMT
jgi:hypothetical protein